MWHPRQSRHLCRPPLQWRLTRVHVTYHPRAPLLRWRPSGVAEFSTLSFSYVLITCPDISLVSFCVYSMSPGQFMDLFLAFPLKSFWESQHEAGMGESNLGCLIFCQGTSISFWLWELVSLKCKMFIEYTCTGKATEPTKHLDNPKKEQTAACFTKEFHALCLIQFWLQSCKVHFLSYRLNKDSQIVAFFHSLPELVRNRMGPISP